MLSAVPKNAGTDARARRRAERAAVGVILDAPTFDADAVSRLAGRDSYADAASFLEELVHPPARGAKPPFVRTLIERRPAPIINLTARSRVRNGTSPMTDPFFRVESESIGLRLTKGIFSLVLAWPWLERVSRFRGPTSGSEPLAFHDAQVRVELDSHGLIIRDASGKPQRIPRATLEELIRTRASHGPA